MFNENSNTEFKEIFVPEIKKEVVAFANTEGGTIDIYEQMVMDHIRKNSRITRSETESITGLKTTAGHNLLNI